MIHWLDSPCGREHSSFGITCSSSWNWGNDFGVSSWQICESYEFTIWRHEQVLLSPYWTRLKDLTTCNSRFIKKYAAATRAILHKLGRIGKRSLQGHSSRNSVRLKILRKWMLSTTLHCNDQRSSPRFILLEHLREWFVDRSLPNMWYRQTAWWRLPNHAHAKMSMWGAYSVKHNSTFYALMPKPYPPSRGQRILIALATWVSSRRWMVQGIAGWRDRQVNSRADASCMLHPEEVKACQQ